MNARIERANAVRIESASKCYFKDYVIFGSGEEKRNGERIIGKVYYIQLFGFTKKIEKLHEIVREKKENKRKVGMKINFKYFSISVPLFKYRIKQGRGDFLNFLSISLLFSEFQTKPQCMSLSFSLAL